MQVFGTEHIIYMIVMIVIMTALLIVFKKFIPKNKMVLPIKIIAGIELILIIINRIVVSKSRSGTFIDFIPNTFCSMMGFILPLTILIFKPNTKIFQYAIFAGMIGGLLTFIYPDFLIYFDNIFNIHPFTGLLYHTFMLFQFLLCIISGYFVPTFKNWSSLLIGLSFMVVFAVFGNTVLGQSNNMYLNAPLLSGTSLTWYLVGVLFLILYTIILQIYEMCTLPKAEWSIVKVFKFFKNKLKKKNNKLIEKTDKTQENKD